MPVADPFPEVKQAPTRRGLARTILRGCAIGLGVGLILEVFNVLAGPNLHEVVPGAIYRTAQPSGTRLARLISQYGIRTVINLRGVSEPAPWYLEECKVTNELNVSQEDLPFSATKLPSWPALRRMVDVIDRSEYPILVHCNRGIDRTGMAVAVALLLHTDATVVQARRQLGHRYGHLAIGHTSHIDRFFDLYEEWLAQHGDRHTPALFRRWLLEDYCPGECRCRLVILNPEVLHALPVNKSVALRVRATNTSVKPWQFWPGSNAGIKCLAELGPRDTEVQYLAFAGMFRAVVPPGQSIELTLALPAVARAGKYALHLDLIDPQHAYFRHMSGDLLSFDAEVR